MECDGMEDESSVEKKDKSDVVRLKGDGGRGVEGKEKEKKIVTPLCIIIQANEGGNSTRC